MFSSRLYTSSKSPSLFTSLLFSFSYIDLYSVKNKRERRNENTDTDAATTTEEDAVAAEEQQINNEKGRKNEYDINNGIKKK